jgi:hypothetical protein
MAMHQSTANVNMVVDLHVECCPKQRCAGVAPEPEGDSSAAEEQQHWALCIHSPASVSWSDLFYSSSVSHE